MPLHTSPKWAISFCTVYICYCPVHKTSNYLMGLLLWPNQNFPPWIPKNKLTADEPSLRMEKFGPEICETSVPHNSTVTMLAILHLSVIEQRQVITITRKESALPGYTVTLSWLLTQSARSGETSEMESPPWHIVSIHPRAYPSWPAWNRWGQSVKLQVSVIYIFARKTLF